MANEISLVTASGRTVTPKDDGIIYEVFSPGNGIIYGGAVTIKDSSTLHITAGHGIVCGRKFTIDDSDIPVALSGSGSLLGRLYIHLDLADAADPITLLVETGASLTPVVQDADVNINNGVYEINLATFDVDTVTISNLVTMDVSVKPMGDMEGATSALDGKGGYVPAPQAGDEDKVLRGDGTWGSAGDTATMKYDPATDTIYLWDGTQWVAWKTAGLNMNPVFNNGVLSQYFSPLSVTYKNNSYIDTGSTNTYCRINSNVLELSIQCTNSGSGTYSLLFMMTQQLDFSSLSSSYSKMRVKGAIIPATTGAMGNLTFGIYDANGMAIAEKTINGTDYAVSTPFNDTVLIPTSGVGYIGISRSRHNVANNVLSAQIELIEFEE